MADQIIIRRATLNEAAVLSDLAFRSKAYWGYSPEFMEACRTELSISQSDLENPEHTYRLAESNGDVVGYYSLERLAVIEYELAALFVDPDYIGQGIGRQLIEHAKSHAKDSGATSIVIQGDPNAEKFYLAAGGVRTGESESGSIEGRYLPEFRIGLS